MNNKKRFEAEGASNASSAELPTWVREMSDRYADTGTVRPRDAARLSETTGAGGQLNATGEASE